MRLLLIASHAPSILNFRKELIRSLKNNHIEVHVVAPGLHAENSIVNELLNLNVILHSTSLSRTGTNPFTDVLSFFTIFFLMLRIRPDIVLAYTVKPVIYGGLAARLARVPMYCALITGLGYVFQGINNKNILQALVQCLYKVSLSKAHKVFFQNSDDLFLFKKLGIIADNNQCRVVNGSGVDLSHYFIVPIPVNVEFLLIARLLGDKGVREYVEAARFIRTIYPDVIFCLVGSVDINPSSIPQFELDEWIAEGTISYFGQLNDVRPAIAQCSVFVLPSYREGTPRSVLEAMSMGRAIITTDAPGCRETVIDGENGFLVPVRSVDGLVEAMKTLIENPELVAQMGQRSREIAEDRYDVHKVNAVMLREMGITQ